MWKRHSQNKSPSIRLKDEIRRKAAEAAARKEPHLPHQRHDLKPDEIVEHEQEPLAEDKISRGEEALILEESRLPEVYRKAELPANLPPVDEILPAVYEKNLPGPLAFTMKKSSTETEANRGEVNETDYFTKSFRGRLKKMLKKIKSIKE